ncbi:MAG: type II toxin-antitoxin system RelB/DinJ family antitoxin [Oscillospiraceae bacterium]|nr:type II toxin-antitoxin system RelB/DinJ family antitoxin [Oscillospiraceae bacterium]
MTDLTSLNIKIDRELKSEADALFNAMGMNLTTAVNIFVRQAVAEQAIPFQIHVNEKVQFQRMLENMRGQASKHGFMSDDDINNEVIAARKEIRGDI